MQQGQEKKTERSKNTFLRSLVIAIVGIFVLELMVFNFRFWTGLFSENMASFSFSWLRLAIEVLFAAFIIAVRPTSGLREQPLQKPQLTGIVALAITLVVMIALVLAIVLSKNYLDSDIDDHMGTRYNNMQYQLMADSLLEGKNYIDLEPPSWLSDMENPYDFEERIILGSETGESALFDYAFYDGKYFMYFGILPAAILFAPYKALTGNDLSTDSAISLLSLIAVLCMWLLVYAVTRCYCKHVSVGDLLLYELLGFFASGIIYLAFCPSFYHIAIVSGLSFAAMGTSCWILAKRKDDRLRKSSLVIGSLCYGCTILCRPTFFLGVLLAFPIFWDEIRGGNGRQRGFFSLNKPALANTACVIVPCLILGCVAMWWNFTRFGSPFDFGASYNLTGFDMTARRISVLGFMYSIALYLFAPPLIISTFPFIGNWPCPFGTIVEPFYEGFLFAVPAAAFLFLVFGKGMRARLKEAGLLGFITMCIIVGIVIMCIDCALAVTQRYQSDFHWLFLIALLPVLQVQQQRERGRRLHVFQVVLVACVAISALLAFQNLFSDTRYDSYATENPELNLEVQSWFIGS